MSKFFVIVNNIKYVFETTSTKTKMQIVVLQSIIKRRIENGSKPNEIAEYLNISYIN